jgi:hypothetical protein
MDYQNHSGPNGTEDNIGGLTNRIWYAPKSAFAIIQDVKSLSDAAVTDEAEYAEIATAHTFQTGKGFRQLYSTMDKGSVEAAPQGELDGRSFKLHGKGFYPGVDPKILGFFRKAKNDQFIVLCELADGTVWQIGSPRFSAYILPSKIGSATNSSGIRGTEYEITSMESGAVIYSGTITMHP